MKSKTKQPSSDFPPLLHLTYILQQKADSQLLSSVGVGLSQVRIMSQLSDGTVMSQIQIAQALHQTEANVSRQLRVMRSAGLVNIERSKNDHRRREVKLTSKGINTYAAARKVLNSYLKELNDVLGAKLVEKLNSL